MSTITLTPDRRPDIDWLRILAVYLLIPFHTAMIFNPAPFYHVRNAEVSPAFLVLCGFIGLWHMPLLFVLAGWSAHASLSTRGVRAFARERVTKLFVPLIAGCILITPIIKYVELKSGLDLSHRGLRVAAELQPSFHAVIPAKLETLPPFAESFFTFLPTFFTDLDRFTWAHLWFVAYLLAFTVAYLPAMALLVRRPQREFPWMRSWCSVYLPIVPLAVIQVFLRPHWPGIQNLYDDWANVAYYSAFLWLGFTLARSPRFEEAVVCERRRALGLASGATLVLLAAVAGILQNTAIVLAMTAVAGWGFIVAGLGFARTRINGETAGLPYLRRSAYPVYILHQLAVVVVGYAVVHRTWGIPAKFALIVIASMVATLLCYELLRRTPAAPLFGAVAPQPRTTRKIFRTATASAIAVVLLIPHVARAQSSETGLLGLWWVEGGGAQVEIRWCESALCGWIVWLRSPFDRNGCAAVDMNNPDRTRRDTPLLGTQVIGALRRDDARHWRDGWIYDPESGRSYRLALEQVSPDRLRLRGYVGLPVFGRSTEWIRVGREHGECEASRVGALP